MSTAPPLLAELIDDAGLFPPARLPMHAAISAHLETREGPWAGLVGRFLCPVDRVDELLAALPAHLERPVRLGLIGGVRTVEDPRVKLELAEVPAADASLRSLQELAGELHRPPMRGRPSIYIELPRTEKWSDDLVIKLAAIKAFGHGAKLRTGGVEATAFPTEDEVATFIRAAVEAGIAFKLTAGLHHAIRHADTATGFEHHGFLNVAAAVAEPADAERWLGERDGLVVAERVRSVDADLVRSRWAAFGSCSIGEPVDDLLELGVLVRS